MPKTPMKTTKAKVITPAPKPAEKPPQKAVAVVQQAVISPETMEKVLMEGNLAVLTVPQRMEYYLHTCTTLGLNAATRPFEYITLDGKMVLYARRDCADQLRARDKIAVSIKSRETDGGVHIVTAVAKNAEGREDEAIGAESIMEPDQIKVWNGQRYDRRPNPNAGKELQGTARANALMKAETKAKRRVTLSLSGLGIPDESEIESIQQVETILETPEAADTAKLIENGATVEVHTPEPEVSPATPEKKAKAAKVEDWRELVCHVGMANGPTLGIKLGTMPSAVIRYLRDKWIPKAGTTKADKALVVAIGQAVEAGAAEPSETPQEAEKPAKATVIPPEEQKPIGGAPASKAEDKTMAWRSVIVNIKTEPGKAMEKINGKTLGQIADSKEGEFIKGFSALPILRSLVNKGIAVLESPGLDKMEITDRIQVNAIKAAAKVTKAFDDPNFLSGLKVEGLLEEVKRRLRTVGVTGEDEIKDFLGNSPDEKFLRQAIEEWPKTEAMFMKGEK